MRCFAVGLVTFILGCGSVGTGGLAPRDASKGDEVDAIAATSCDPSSEFSTPTPVLGLSTGGDERIARFSSDELDVYLQAVYSQGELAKIYVASRASIGEPFKVPLALAGDINAPMVNESDPSVTSDGLTLIFSAIRVSGEGAHIYTTSRPSRIGDFGAVTKVAFVNATMTSSDDVQPYIATGDDELWLSSDRSGGLGRFDIYRSVRSGSGFIAAVAVAGLNSAADDQSPVVSADRLTVYFASTRANSDDLDIWMSHRRTTEDGFPEPVLVDGVNSASHEYPTWLSVDGCRLYFMTGRGGSNDIYVASHTR